MAPFSSQEILKGVSQCLSVSVSDPDLLVSLLLGLVSQLLVLFLHQTSHLSIVGITCVMLLDPNETSRRAIGHPKGVEGSDHFLIVAVRFSQNRHMCFLLVVRGVLFSNLGKDVTIDGVEALGQRFCLDKFLINIR